jgi:hypothetical protein
LMKAADKVWITELTLLHKNIRSVRNSHVQELTLILKIIGQCDIKHTLTSPIKSITPVMKISTYIITSITARPVRLAVILVIMSVSTFKTTVILFYMYRYTNNPKKLDYKTNVEKSKVNIVLQNNRNHLILL